MAMSWELVSALTSHPAYLYISSCAVRSEERLYASLIIGEPDTALTSDLAYPVILFA